MNIYTKPNTSVGSVQEFHWGDDIPSQQSPASGASPEEEWSYVTAQVKEGDVLEIPVRVAHVTHSRVKGAGPVVMKVVALAPQGVAPRPSDVLWIDTRGESFARYRGRALSPNTDTFGFPHREVLLAAADFVARSLQDTSCIPNISTLASALGHTAFPESDQDSLAYEHWTVSHSQRTAWQREYPTQLAFNTFAYQAIAVALGNKHFANPSFSIQDVMVSICSPETPRACLAKLRSIMEAVDPYLPINPEGVLAFIDSEPLGVSLPTIRYSRGGRRLTFEALDAWVDDLSVAFQASGASQRARRKKLEDAFQQAVANNNYALVSTLAQELMSLGNI